MLINREMLRSSRMPQLVCLQIRISSSYSDLFFLVIFKKGTSVKCSISTSWIFYKSEKQNNIKLNCLDESKHLYRPIPYLECSISSNRCLWKNVRGHIEGYFRMILCSTIISRLWAFESEFISLSWVILNRHFSSVI